MTDPSFLFSLVLAAATAFALGMLVLCADTTSRDKIIAFAIGASAVIVGLQVGGANGFTVLVLVWVILHLNRQPYFSTAMGCLLVSAGLIASTVLAGDLVGNPKLAVQLIALAATAVFLAIYTNERERLTMMYGALTTICVGCVYGLGQLAGILPSRTEVLHLDVSAIGRPSGIWPEPDWLGMYAGVGILLAFHLPLRRGVRLLAMSLCTVLWVLAFARAGWLALLGVIVVSLLAHLFSRNRKAIRIRLKGRPLAVTGSIVAITAPILYFGDIAADLVVRLGRTFSAQSDDISGQARIQQTEGLLHLADTAPWFGHGLSAAGRVGVSGKLYFTGDDHGNNVASNWILGLWVDAQFLAIPFFLVIAALIVMTIRSLPGQFLLLIAANSLFSNGTFVPVFWFAIALALAATARPSSVEPEAHNSIRPAGTSDQTDTLTTV